MTNYIQPRDNLNTCRLFWKSKNPSDLRVYGTIVCDVQVTRQIIQVIEKCIYCVRCKKHLFVFVYLDGTLTLMNNATSIQYAEFCKDANLY